MLLNEKEWPVEPRAPTPSMKELAESLGDGWMRDACARAVERAEDCIHAWGEDYLEELQEAPATDPDGVLWGEVQSIIMSMELGLGVSAADLHTLDRLHRRTEDFGGKLQKRPIEPLIEEWMGWNW